MCSTQWKGHHKFEKIKKKKEKKWRMSCRIFFPWGFFENWPLLVVCSGESLSWTCKVLSFCWLVMLLSLFWRDVCFLSELPLQWLSSVLYSVNWADSLTLLRPSDCISAVAVVAGDYLPSVLRIWQATIILILEHKRDLSSYFENFFSTNHPIEGK